MKHNNITKRLAALLDENPMGVTSADASKLLGATAKTICRSGNELRDQHKVAVFRLRFTSLIVPAANVQAVREHLIEQRLRNAEAKKAERADKDRERSTQRRAWDRHEAWAEREPVHRVVAAGKARPLGKLGPRSVFEVAA